MNEREQFLVALEAEPGDDTGLLAFADLLQERGEEPLAARIRNHVAATAGLIGTDPPPDWTGHQAAEHILRGRAALLIRKALLRAIRHGNATGGVPR